MNNKRGPIEDSEFTNKFFWKEVPNNAWQGKPCYIIGGGPSLEKQWTWLLPRLWGQFTIGINRVYEKFTPTIIFGMDTKFIRWIQMGKYGDEAKKRWDETNAYKVWLCTQPFRLPDDVYVLKCFGGYHHALHSFPSVMEAGIGHGQNSGYGALNLAACLGANPIYLLGFDMQRDGDRTNWHDGHPQEYPEHVPKTFRKHFIVASKELKKRKIDVINLNPNSALKCFPKMEMLEGFEGRITKVVQHDAEIKKTMCENVHVDPEDQRSPTLASSAKGWMKIADSHIRGKENFPFGSSRLTNRFLHEVLPDGAWRNKPCFIVGGGPSLKNFDWSLLKGKYTIGINRAYERFDPTVIFSMDTRFLLWIMQGKYGPEATEKFSMSTAYKIWLCTYNCKLPEDVFIIRVWKNYRAGFRAFANNLKYGIGHGDNSGYAAINLAACLGANPIYLLGFDMKYKMENNQRQTHWHGGHPVSHRANTVLKYIKYFPHAAKAAKEMNLRIINLNPESGLKCFPKKPWQGVLL